MPTDDQVSYSANPAPRPQPGASTCTGEGGSKLRVLDLFSGIGGFSLGLERTQGFETVAFCEIDPFCRRVLAKQWPGVPCYDDVRELTANTLARRGITVDVISGGFPCQDVSIAGDRKGLEGERSGLWREMRRLVRVLRPLFVLVENTTGLLDLGMGDVLADLASLGYDACWHGIPASAVGAAHARDRLWIVAYLDRKRRSQRTQRDREHALQVLQNINRQLALSLECGRDQQFDADALDGFGARIPDGRAERTAYVRAALRRKVDGIPGDLDALRSLGNAVVPQIPELIGRAILEARKAA